MMARILFAMFVVGGALGTLALPFAGYLSHDRVVGVLVDCGTCFAAAGLILATWRRLPPWGFQAFLALGTVVVSVAMFLNKPVPADTAMFYVWVALFAAYFFTRGQALGQLGLIGVCYATVLAVGGGTAGGATRWLMTMGTLVLVAALVTVLKDVVRRRIEERQRSEHRLEESLSLLDATLESTADGILVVDREGSIVSFNQKFQDMWRIPDEIVESRDDDRAVGFIVDQLADPEQFLRKVRELYDRPAAESYDVLQFTDGRVFERHSQPQRGSDDKIFGRVWSFRDVSERERAQEQLRRLADRDALTGLFNRRRFEQEISRQVTQAERYGTPGAVLLLDFDDFKYVNDSLGHRAGDSLIKSVAEVLRDRVRDSDVLARIGGDEFAVLLPHAHAEQAKLAAEGLLEALRRHRAVFGGQRVRVTASIGVAPVAHPQVQTGEELLVEADAAMYDAKEAGRDRVVVYSPIGRPGPGRAGLPDRIRSAIEDHRLTLYAQPILDLQSDEISQYELLLRMVDEKGEVLPPRAFLATAERFGLIQEMDEWVARSAIRLIEKHRKAGRELRLEVNLSGRTMGSSGLPKAVAEELAQTSIDPSNLIFEVTETAAIASMDEAREFASLLTDLGCRVALDDFGAGFSSFYYLKYLPLDFLKIDGDFITNLGRNQTDQAVVKAIVELSRNLDKRTIAEFVGDDETVRLLREYGVDFAQGYHIGHPQPVSEMWADVRAPEAEAQQVESGAEHART